MKASCIENPTAGIMPRLCGRLSSLQKLKVNKFLILWKCDAVASEALIDDVTVSHWMEPEERKCNILAPP